MLIAPSSVAVAAAGNGVTAVLAYAAAGFACSAMLPLSLSLAGRNSPARATSSGELIAGDQVGLRHHRVRRRPAGADYRIGLSGIYIVGAGVAVALAVIARAVTARRAHHPTPA